MVKPTDKPSESSTPPADAVNPAEQTKRVQSKSATRQIDDILAKPEGQDYLKMCEITGQLQKRQLYEDPVKATDFAAAYYLWVEMEKPKLEMPKMPNKNTVAIPATFTRLFHKGKEWLIVGNTNGVQEGVKYTVKYAEETHPTSFVPINIGIIIGHEATYFLAFDPAEVKARMEYAEKLMEYGQRYVCYIKMNDRNYLVSPENFLRPWKDLMKDIANKIPLHV